MLPAVTLRRVRRALSAVSATSALAALVLVTGAPSAYADTTAPVAAATSTTAPTDDEPALTPAEVAAQVARAAELRRRATRTDTRLAAATAKVERLSAASTTALAKVRRARERQAAATAEMVAQLRRLSSLQGQVDESQADLGRWAREAYTTGGPLQSYQGWLTALGGTDTDDVAHDLAVLEHVGLVGSIDLDRLQVATAAQQDAATKAAAAARAANAARAAADAAKKAADTSLHRQRDALAALQAEQARTTEDLARTRQQLLSNGSSAALVAEAQLAEAMKGRGQDTDVSGCAGSDLSGYPNGEIPAAALCPVWGAPGALLRADAATAFRGLSREYALAFGTPICVTDSYRSRAAQFAVYAAKPGLAAVPGTSNHGLGTAADLCGGIQSFGTPEHAWLLAHAPVHGWFHPAWAEPSGSKPEPWHWEFSG